MAPCRSPPPRALAALLLLLALLCGCAVAEEAQPHVHTHHDQQQAQQRVHNEMNDLVDSVKQAVHDADSTVTDKSQVIDIGQSLTLLETKFSNLRSALSNELGVASGKVEEHSASSKTLMDQSSNLVKSVVSQREQLSKLSSDVSVLDNAIKELRSGLQSFDNDVHLLNDVVQQLHASNRDLSYSNQQISHRVSLIQNDHDSFSAKSRRNGRAKWLVLVIIAELLVFAAYVYLKKFADGGRSRSAAFAPSKAYSKFG